MDPTPVTVTVGVAAWREGETLEETIHRADEALYGGKRAGRDCVVIDEVPQSLAQKLSA